MPRLTEIGPLQTDDHILALVWSPDGTELAVTPATGQSVLVTPDGRVAGRVDGHALGNGQPAWFDGEWWTCGFDGRIRSQNGKTLPTGRGIIEKLSTSPDGGRLAAGQGKDLLVFDNAGATDASLRGLPAAVADFAWNPSNPAEIATVGAGGARMFRLGESEPFARFDWGGASLSVAWSPDGRWLVTGDQTPSVHLYDFTRDYPLHIQGYETKVRAMAFSPDSRKLATGGSSVLTVWPCTGPSGPEGVTPVQLDGFDADVLVASFAPDGCQAATGDDTGVLLFFTFDGDQVVRRRVRRDAGISAIAWHPKDPLVAVGHNDGTMSLLVLEA
ncbi:MAG: hypothetical protein SFU53_16135 [Terrimicrobiaceae bacterium]|nr:hypothetical protein [Terrimicrobiaceae bacterium]